MAEPLRIVIAAVLMAAGVVAAVCSGYLQYVSLPEEHTVAQRSKRLALALGGIALIVGGSHLLS
jgi:hypothetical protein